MSDKRSKLPYLFVNGHSEGDYVTIFKKYFPKLKEYACLFVPDSAAEDIVQDILVYLWENREKLTINTSLEAYLFRSVYQRCISHFRRQQILSKHHGQMVIQIKQEELAYFDPEQNEALRHLFMNDLKKDLDAAIESLPQKCREVFILSFIHELRNKEISEKLQISSNTVESHITNALKTLRERLRKIIPFF